MNVRDFAAQRRRVWDQLAAFLEQASGLGLHRISLEMIRDGYRAYRETVRDLAYARMKFPGHPVTRQLEQLVLQAHSIVYRPRARWKFRPGDWWQQWCSAVIRHWRLLLAIAVLFWLSAAAGTWLTSVQPALADQFISPDMQRAIEEGRLWTESIVTMAPQAGGFIFTNNVAVALTTWLLGLFGGLGCFYPILLNGVLLGAVFVRCAQVGLADELAAFVVAHGCLELPAIWIAGAAGWILGKALLFPSRYRRTVELRHAARESFRLLAGVVPLLFVAAIIEAFVSPTGVPAWQKALVGLTALSLWIMLTIAGARRIAQPPKP